MVPSHLLDTFPYILHNLTHPASAKPVYCFTTCLDFHLAFSHHANTWTWTHACLPSTSHECEMNHMQNMIPIPRLVRSGSLNSSTNQYQDLVLISSISSGIAAFRLSWMPLRICQARSPSCQRSPACSLLSWHLWWCWHPMHSPPQGSTGKDITGRTS